MFSGLPRQPPCTQPPRKQRNVYIWVLFDQTRTSAGAQHIALLLISHLTTGGDAFSSHEVHGNPDAFSVPFIASSGSITVSAVSASVNTCNISEASGGAQGLPSIQIFILFPTAWHALATRK